MEAAVGEPRIEEIEKRSLVFKKQKMMRLTIPVNAGYLYRVGEIKIEGNKAVNVKYLRSLVKFLTGEIYSTKVREKSIEDMAEVYRDVGYVYVQVIPVENLDPKNKIVNVTFNVDEGEVAFLNRLDFRGNNLHQGQGHPAGDDDPGGRPLQPEHVQEQHPADQAARARRPREGPRHQARPGRPDQDRRPGQRQGAAAEQHPVHRRLQRLRGHVRGLQLLHGQLPRGRRDPGANRPAGQARQELLLRLHRALSLRQAHHGGLQHLRPEDRLQFTRPLQAEDQGHRPDPRDAAFRDVADEHDLQHPEGRASPIPKGC